jgi:hypothetical protein
MSKKEYDTDKIMETYLKYLNGPLGKGVMEHLHEGASFTVRANQKLVEVSKFEGKAVVRLVQENDKELSNLGTKLS